MALARLQGRSTGLRIAAFAVLAMLSACSSGPSGGVQVVDRSGESAPRSPVRSGEYKVQRGDTLFGIAFRFGWDWKALAAHNGISAPYVIRPGQRIRFAGARQQVTAVAASRTPQVRPQAIPPPLVISQPTVRSSPSATVAKPSVAARATTPVQSVTRSASGWAWPASGTLIGKFSSNGSLNKGIDLAGELGQPVLAASNGTVVYAGSGLRGYGELVIIKHSDTYVSAYGHNRRLLVKEGQQVKVGQMIAEMGSTGTDRVKLHFEIRRQGKPVDPLQYLPSR